jgi:hypothetical protein
MYFDVDNMLIEQELFEKKFVCNLTSCKGACCVQGDAGAPITYAEIDDLENNLSNIIPYLSPEGKNAIEKSGVFYMDVENEPVTTLIEGKACAFSTVDDNGIVKCAIETAYLDKKSSVNKPISCHLYPIRIKKLHEKRVLVFDEWEICNPACELGENLKIPVYKFLKEPLKRVFGEEFYNDMCLIEKDMDSIKN